MNKCCKTFLCKVHDILRQTFSRNGNPLPLTIPLWWILLLFKTYPLEVILKLPLAPEIGPCYAAHRCLGEQVHCSIVLWAPAHSSLSSLRAGITSCSSEYSVGAAQYLALAGIVKRC